jgi:hypothetical protein
LQILPITGINEIIFPVNFAISRALNRGIFAQHTSIYLDTLHIRLFGIQASYLLNSIKAPAIQEFVLVLKRICSNQSKYLT